MFSRTEKKKLGTGGALEEKDKRSKEVETTQSSQRPNEEGKNTKRIPVDRRGHSKTKKE